MEPFSKKLIPEFWFCVVAGLCAVASYSTNLSVPVSIAVPIFLLLAGKYLGRGFHGRVFSFMGVLLFCLPYLHTVGFLFSDEYLFYPSYDITVTDQLNPELRSQLALMGLVGLCGLIGGALTPRAMRRCWNMTTALALRMEKLNPIRRLPCG